MDHNKDTLIISEIIPVDSDQATNEKKRLDLEAKLKEHGQFKIT